MAHLWLDAPHLAVADFRREYAISVADLDTLDVSEWSSLLCGLSFDSRFLSFHRNRLGGLVPATVPAMTAPSEVSQEEYLRGLSRHSGAVVMLGGDL